jgi:Asp-tRNA(Asn)/Glu-tRNA(Gln) amidotransferase A subunit family amidase
VGDRGASNGNTWAEGRARTSKRSNRSQTVLHHALRATLATYHRWMEVVVAVTLSGCPALSVPVGLGPEGLPMGV